MTNPLFDALIAPHRNRSARFAQRPRHETVTYDAYLNMAGRAAHALDAAGLTPGDRLVVQVAKSVEALAIYAACIARGIVFVPLNTAYTTPEVAYFVGDATPSLILCDPASAAEVEALGPPVLTLAESGTGSFADAMQGKPTQLDPVDRAPDDLAAFLYTSGTTGRSKGAMLTQQNLLSNAQALVQAWRITADDTLIHALPIFHAHGLFVAINTTLLSGAGMIFLSKFDVDAVLDALPRSTTMMGVPTFYTRLLADDRFTTDATRDMRLFVSGSAPLLAETHRAFEARTGHRILERYGMTETGMNASNPYDGERRAGTVGHPLPGVEIRVTENGAEVAEGKIGMVEVRGPNVFKGYWQMPDKTAEELAGDGWFTTGDLGQLDADGYLTIVGRQKDLVISGGFNVYPKEVEDVLDAVPGVGESAVIGVPHPDFGEGVVAILTGTPDMDVVKAAVSQQLADYKRPKRFVTVDALPRNTMGKVQKADLRDRYKDSFA
ncbi:malonate--CoA ligase [Palleronia abyssalis]|uniref:Long-chain-fatty-acid--CoA ligase n=1 Tax=Palleronia abyssalis TaxID=1501240 RepID=A0A2R8BYR7_9RHOB|nr:malonyl-CoA synthase [Palleronia abyssalis]SPJ25279.1 Long-chain-fatty-acid--CoA ligase [Palleronia abyssalis]